LPNVGQRDDPTRVYTIHVETPTNIGKSNHAKSDHTKPAVDARGFGRSTTVGPIVNDLIANRFTPGITVFDDGVKDKLKGSKKARDLFFADIDKKDKDADKVKAKKGELIVDLAELLTL